MAAPHPTFTLTHRHGIWRVTLDGVFFGDYRTEQHARESIAETQRKPASKSRIVLGTDDRRIPPPSHPRGLQDDRRKG